MLVAQSCVTLCDPMDYSPPGPSVHGILQARVLKWAATPFSRGSPCIASYMCAHGIEPVSPALAGGFFTTEAPGKPLFLININNNQTSLSIYHVPGSCVQRCACTTSKFSFPTPRSEDTEAQGLHMLQWLRSCPARQGTWVWALVRELRSRMP